MTQPNSGENIETFDDEPDEEENGELRTLLDALQAVIHGHNKSGNGGRLQNKYGFPRLFTNSRCANCGGPQQQQRQEQHAAAAAAAAGGRRHQQQQQQQQVASVRRGEMQNLV